MIQEQRQIELINWITNLKNESLLKRMEELRVDSFKNIPGEILSLLDSSNKTEIGDLTEHTSTRDILNK